MRKYNVYFNLTLIKTFFNIQDAIDYIATLDYPKNGRYYIA